MTPADADDLVGSPNPLAAHYRRFAVGRRLLLTGHSHQAWPDCAEEGLLESFADAAELADRKWERALAKADQVRAGFARLLGDDSSGRYSLASSTHDLLVRLLSALPLDRRPRLLSTDAEFYSARRQLLRLEEAGIEVLRLPARPAADVGARLAAAVDDRTALVLVSTVFFDDAAIAGGLEELSAACRRHGAALLLDAYHQLNVVPFSLRELGLEDAFVVGGGYKYCQLGEGNAFLRFPESCRLRPLVTGWFAAFGQLEHERWDSVEYSDGNDRFAGATYDPASHYRGARVFRFFREMEIGPERLRRVSQRQLCRLAGGFDALALDPRVIDRDRTVPLEQRGGFLALTSPRAAELCAALAVRGVRCDSRGPVLRLGPAPYTSDAQLDEAIAVLGEVADG